MLGLEGKFNIVQPLGWSQARICQSQGTLALTRWIHESWRLGTNKNDPDVQSRCEKHLETMVCCIIRGFTRFTRFTCLGWVLGLFSTIGSGNFAWRPVSCIPFFWIVQSPARRCVQPPALIRRGKVEGGSGLMTATVYYGYSHYNVVPPSDVCWFINPINYSYIIYHKP